MPLALLMPLAALKALVFLLCLIPLGHYAWGAWHDTLGANPIEAVTRGLGSWALNFLLITLTVTPLRKLTGWHVLMRLRRLLGLFAFFYAVLHLTTYLWLDQFFDWGEIAQDILKRPFITVGMATFFLLVPLAVTSNRFAIKRLGGRRWQNLHRTVYASAILAVLHYSWLVKADQSQPLLYAGILVLLLGARVSGLMKPDNGAAIFRVRRRRFPGVAMNDLETCREQSIHPPPGGK